VSVEGDLILPRMLLVEDLHEVYYC
jgi:hypothetical protein